MITIAIVDDDKYVQEGLATQLRRISPEFTVTGTYNTVPELLDDAASAAATVVLLDVRLGPGNSLNANIAALQSLDTNIVAVTVDTTRPEIALALRRHPVSVVHKNDLTDATLEVVIRLAADGGRYVTPDVQRRLDGGNMPKLTPRQDDVLRLLVTGMPLRRVADKLHVTPGVVYDHLDDIERRFTAAGHPIRDEGDTSRTRGWNLGRKAIEIGYVIDPLGSD